VRGTVVKRSTIIQIINLNNRLGDHLLDTGEGGTACEGHCRILLLINRRICIAPPICEASGAHNSKRQTPPDSDSTFRYRRGGARPVRGTV